MKTTTKDKLDKEMLKYYQRLNEKLDLKEQTAIQLALTPKQTTNTEMCELLKNMNDEEIINKTYDTLVKYWEDTNTYSPHEYGSIGTIFSNLSVREYFLDKKIDLKLLGFTSIYSFSGQYNPSNYFDLYGLPEKMRWEKIKTAINNKIEEWVDQKSNEEFDEKIDKFVEKARQDNLLSVNQSHIKRYASELKINISGEVGLITNTVSVRLNKDLENNLPKRKRTLTSSIKIEVLKRDDFKCQICGAEKGTTTLHVHHKIPVSRAGTDDMNNLITLCESCNFSIGNRIYDTDSITQILNEKVTEWNIKLEKINNKI